MVREMERTDTPLPEPGVMTPAQHIQIRDRFWDEHLPIEMDKGNRLQASEKIWGSVAHAANAIAKDRGWRTGDRDAIRDVVIQLGAEQDSSRMPKKATYRRKRQFNGWLNSAVDAHNNFYRNDLHEEAIRLAEADAEQLISELEKLQGKNPKSFAPTEDSDILRLGRLLDIRDPDSPRRHPSIDYLKRFIEMNKSDPNGFSPNYGYRKPGTHDDGGEAHPVARPPSGSPPPEGSRAKPIPQSGQEVTPKVNLKPGKQLGQGDAIAGTSATGRRTRRSRSKDEQPTSVNIKFG